METNQAEENLKVIRTLMERAALYRRRLGPIMLCAGLTAIILGIGGFVAKLNTPRPFVILWSLAALWVVGFALYLNRREGLQKGEPLFTPSLKKVVGAGLIPLLCGGLYNLDLLWAFVWYNGGDEDFTTIEGCMGTYFAVFTWLLFYGMALIASGQYCARGMRQLGWAFVLTGCLGRLGGGGFFPHLIGYDNVWDIRYSSPWVNPNLLMAMTFGGYHLIAAAYLFVTEKRGSSS